MIFIEDVIFKGTDADQINANELSPVSSQWFNRGWG
jgi:hypothetical protein